MVAIFTVFFFFFKKCFCMIPVACNILAAHSHRHDFFQPFVSNAKQQMYVSWWRSSFVVVSNGDSSCCDS